MQTGKSGKIISKSPKVWKVRESQGILKECSAWSGKVRENCFAQIFDYGRQLISSIKLTKVKKKKFNFMIIHIFLQQG